MPLPAPSSPRPSAGEMNSPDEITAYLRAALATDESDAPAWLQRITARTLVIGGAQDHVFGSAMAETFDAIGNARLHLLPAKTNMAPVERASKFRREIAAFFAGCRALMVRRPMQ